MDHSGATYILLSSMHAAWCFILLHHSYGNTSPTSSWHKVSPSMSQCHITLDLWQIKRRLLVAEENHLLLKQQDMLPTCNKAQIANVLLSNTYPIKWL